MSQRFTKTPNLIFLRFVMPPAALKGNLERFFSVSSYSKRDNNDKGRVCFPVGGAAYTTISGLTKDLSAEKFRLTSAWLKKIENQGVALILKYSRNGKASPQIKQGVKMLRPFLAGLWGYCQVYIKERGSVSIVDLAGKVLDPENVPDAVIFNLSFTPDDGWILKPAN